MGKVHIINNVLLQYNKGNEADKILYQQISKRLMYENKGGMRIIKPTLVPLVAKMITSINTDIKYLIPVHDVCLSDIVKRAQTDAYKKQFICCNQVTM